MKNKLIYMFVIFLMIFSVGSFTANINANYSDDIVGNDLEKEMRYLNKEGIMLGDGAGTFGPNRSVTRAEFAAFVARAIELPIPIAGAIEFEDVPAGYMGNLDIEINRASVAGLIIGYNGKFRPGDKISRQEMAEIIKRALILKGIGVDLELVPLTFTDQETIADWAKEAVQFNVSLKIINGYPDGSFKPTDPAIRAHAAKVIYQMLNAIEPIAEPIKYHVVSLNSDGTEIIIATFEKVEKAMELVNQSNDTSYHVKENEQRFVWIPEHLDATVTASGNPYVLVYQDESLLKEFTFVQTGSQLDFVSMKGNALKVKISGVTGYVDLDRVTLNPGILSPLKSFYSVNSSGSVDHYVYLNGKYGWYTYMKASPEMVPGTKYYNTDGKTFGEEELYQYFNYLPLNTKTNYTAEQLNEYVAVQRPTSPLKELGENFKNVEAQYGVNALHLLALAIHEGAWGESRIAQDKKNLFGIGAFDSDAYNSAIEYDSFEDSIIAVAEKLSKNYISLNGSYYNGPLLGNKSVGMNMKYASDPYWGQKTAGRMMRIDNFLGNVDTNAENRYRIGVKLIDDALNVRSAPRGDKQYNYPANRSGISMVIVGEEIANDGTTWYKIISDHPDYEFGYVYAYGDQSLAELVKELEFNN